MKYNTFMRWLKQVLVVLVVVGTVLVPGARAAETDVRRLMGVVEQWVELRETTHREQTEWNAQRETMRHSLLLLERERDLLTERIAAAAAEMDELTEAEWEEEQLRTALRQRLTEAAGQVGADSREPLPDVLRMLLDKTVRDHREHRTLHLDRARMTTPEGRQIQMEQLRVGLAQAYAISPDDQYAAHGVWDGAEWQWQWDRTWAASIRTALRIAAGEIPPRWVALPVTILDAEVAP